MIQVEQKGNLYMNTMIRILFTEGHDLRILKTVEMLQKHSFIQPIVYGNRTRIESLISKHHLSCTRMTILDPIEFNEKEKMVNKLVELRHGKTNEQTAREWIEKDTYFCTLYTLLGYADCLIGGSINSTADTLRPILQLVKPKSGYQFMSSCFIMRKQEKLLYFADCSMNREPNVDQIVEITKQTVETAKRFHSTPTVALLSYSTKGSGRGESIDKMRKATEILQDMDIDYIVDGEMQVDCALNPTVAKLKAPNSPIQGTANVLIFPDLNAANIGYKLVANLAGYQAIGPILQGLSIPMNDLSRSATVEEIYIMSMITVLSVTKE